jgi:hypothetical protein
MHASGPRPTPSHPIPPIEDPRVTEPRPEPITELPDPSARQGAAGNAPAPQKLV